jgi:Ser/Thr protein kinase RdoA (MazF antagonist)
MSNALGPFLATMVAGSQVPLERAVELARERYGVQARAVRLTGERDENFKLTTAAGAEYILKIASPAEEPMVSELLTAALRHLEKTDPTLPCPRVVCARGGAPQVRFVDHLGVERTARMLTYLPGKLLGTTRGSAAQRAACGRMAGRLTQALGDFGHPAAQRAMIWDLRHVGQVPRLLEDLPHMPYREVGFDLLVRMVPRIESSLPRLRQQVVHNDLNAHNILVDAEDEAQITGVIDFGDMTHTALIADVAVTAAELLPEDCRAGSGDVRDAICEVATAYHGCVPLLREELAILGTLAAGRLVTNLVVQEWHLRRNPLGQHYAALDPDFIRVRLEIAKQLLSEEFEL